jgi:hypothetical protein
MADEHGHRARPSRVVDAQPDPGREDDGDRLQRRVFGPLIRMGVAPRLDPGAVATYGRQAGVLCGIERLQHRRSGRIIRHRVRFAIVYRRAG